jgi:general secretion pathway protein J
MNKRAAEQGFTLLEMLVSITLLSLLLVALFGGLRFAGRSDARVAKVVSDSQDLDLVRDLLTRQLADAFPLTADGDHAPRLLFTGSPDRLAFTILRGPGQGTAGLVLAVFDITSLDGISSLFYREYPFRFGATVMVADQPSRSTRLAQSRGSMHFHYRGQSDVWQDDWNSATALPRLVSLRTPAWPEMIAGPRAEAMSR